MPDNNYSFRLSGDKKLEREADRVIHRIMGRPTRYTDDVEAPLPLRAVVAAALVLLGAAADKYEHDLEAIGDTEQSISLFSVLRMGLSAVKTHEQQTQPSISDAMAEMEQRLYAAFVEALRSGNYAPVVTEPTKKAPRGVAAKILANLSQNFESHDEEED